MDDRPSTARPTSRPRATRAALTADATRIGAELAQLDDGTDPFAAAVRASPVPTVVTDPRRPDNPVVFANDAFCRLTGYTRTEVLGRNCRFLQGPETDPAAVERIRAAVARAEPIDVVLCNYRKGGEAFWNRLMIAPVRDAVGEVAYFVASQVDITAERERAAGLKGRNAALAAELAERLRAQERSEARLARLLATVPAGIVELDADGGFTYANSAAERILGAAPGGLVGRRYDDPAWQVTDFDGAPVPPERLPGAWALRGEAVLDYGHALTALDGCRVALLMDVAPVRGEPDAEYPQGRVESALAAFQDVTARQAAVKALGASEERLRELVGTLDLAAVFVRDLDGTVRFWSKGCERLYGWSAEEAVGRSTHELLRTEFPAPVAQIEAALRREGEWRGDLHQVRRNGAALVVAVRKVLRSDQRGRPVAVMESVADVTALRGAQAELEELNATLEARVAERTAELRQAVDALHAEALERAEAEEQLRQSQKMEAVGQLTGGIAHDFNNMLQAIGGSLDMLWRRVGQGRLEEAARFAESAHETVARAAALTHRLLAFARRQALDPKPVEPDRLVEGMAELIRRTVGRGIELELRLRDGTWTVLCDPNQLENVLLNLAINARDAMQPDGGRLTIAVADVRLEAADVAGQEGAEPGEYVEVLVSDTGSGMDEATRAQAFEPFFTTKPLGQGTGLGLSQLYGFVRQSGGVVHLDSAPGRGTTVRLYLPRHAPTHASRAQQVATTMAEPAAEAAASSGTVLLVEDEAGVRTAVAERLRELGYAVLEAADGPAALRLLLRSAEGARLDLLVTDVGLPGGLNGRQVAEMARERRPGLPVLFVTGYAGGVLDGQLAPGMAAIGKPFALDDLAGCVRAMLEAATP